MRRISAEIAADRFDIATCPYRAVPGGSLWPLLEALGMNTEFWASAFVAKMMEGVRFTVGPTVAARRAVFDRIRGTPSVRIWRRILFWDSARPSLAFGWTCRR